MRGSPRAPDQPRSVQRALQDMVGPSVGVRVAGAGAPAVEVTIGELRIAATMAPGRAAEFLGARACARVAAKVVDTGLPTLGVGSHGQPLWPDGVLGSLTHSHGLRAAAVARTDNGPVALGIDVEPATELPADVRAEVLSQVEGPLVQRFGFEYPCVPWDRLVFSARESLFKAWFPIGGRLLGFGDGQALPKPDGTFEAEVWALTHDGRRLTPVEGRWSVVAGWVLTVVVGGCDWKAVSWGRCILR